MIGARRTYSHLAGARRVPTSYEIGTSRLLYYVERGGFAVNLPTADWYRRHQAESPLVRAHAQTGAPADPQADPKTDPKADRTSPRPAESRPPAPSIWEEFADPRATTYASYVSLQRDREAFLARVLEPAQVWGQNQALAPEWIEALDRTLPPLRFVFHGLQMTAAYLGQLAPGGRVAVAALFQTADEVRRIHGIARRMVQLRGVRPGLGDDSRQRWESDPSWQPLRRVVEQLFVTYDWGEALVALNLCVRPMVDELFLVGAAALAERHGDHADALLLRSFAEDGAWQRAWTLRLLQLVGRDAGNGGAREVRGAIARWAAHWWPLASAAVTEAATNLGPEGPNAANQARQRVAGIVESFTREGGNGT